MKGKIKAYSDSVNAGLITCENGKIYFFTKCEWNEDYLPSNNQKVEFGGETGQAKNVTIPDTH